MISYKNVDRRPTNRWSRLLMFVFIGWWLIVGFYALSNRTVEAARITARDLGMIMDMLLPKVLPTFICAFVYLLFVRLFPRAFVCIVVIINWIVLILMLGIWYLIFTMLREYWYVIVPSAMLTTMFHIAAVYGVARYETTSIAESLKTSCRMILSKLYTIPIALVFSLLTVIPLTFFYYVHQALGKEDVGSFILNCWGLCWALFLIHDMQHVSLVTAFCTWHRSEDKDSLELNEVVGKILPNLWYHFGTMVVGSSFWSWPAQWLSVCTSEITQTAENRQAFLVSIVGKLHFYFSPHYLWTRSAYVITVLDGSCYYTAVKKAYELISRNPLKTMAFLWFYMDILNIMMVLSGVGFAPFSFSQLNQMSKGEHITPDYPLIVSFMCSTLMWVALCAIMTSLRAAMLAELICSLDDEEINVKKGQGEPLQDKKSDPPPMYPALEP